MPTERRRFRRISHHFEGTWPGASGITSCRIADISLGGCFVHSLSTPSKGDATSVTIRIGPHQLTFEGVVAYVEPRMGFALQFNEIPSDDLQELGRLLKALEEDSGPPTPGSKHAKA
jgi:PilZ domain